MAGVSHAFTEPKATRARRGAPIAPAHDPIEHDANRTAEVMTGVMPRPSSLPGCAACAAADAPCAACGSTTRHVRRAAANAAGATMAAPGPAVMRALATSGEPLPDALRARFERRLGDQADLSGVRVHRGEAPGRAARALGASAFALGRDIAFAPGAWSPGTPRGERLIAHEVAHTLQEAPALAADTPRRQADAGVPDAGIADASPADAVAEALGRPDPVAGIGDLGLAFRLLNGMSAEGMYDAAVDLDRRFLLDQLLASRSAAQGTNVERTFAILQMAKLSRAPASAVPEDMVRSAGADAEAGLPTDQLLQIFTRIIRSRQAAPDAAAAAEGVLAMFVAGDVLRPEVLGTPGREVPAGPWQPPGNQPIGYYIGNQAHIGIAAEYVAMHPGDQVWTNYTPVNTIIRLLQAAGQVAKPDALDADQLALKPDILNGTRRHLYEIKPATASALAVTEAKMYASLFATAGIPITLGPMNEPGTRGVVPAPGGVYAFDSPAPGAIVYAYRRAQLKEVRVPEAEGERRWELKPLSREQQEALARGTVMAALTAAAMALLYILAGAGMLLGG
jgi:hypothetical protein